MTLNSAYTQEYHDIIDSLDGDIPGRRIAHAYMQNSTAVLHDIRNTPSYTPRFFDQDTYNEFKRISETAHQMVCKVVQKYLDDPAYRTIFDYDPRLVDLILIPRGYDSLIPFCRIDTFMNEDDLTCGFCEFNSDGSSGLNEDREVNLSFTATPAFTEFKKRHRVTSSNLFDPWVEEFMNIYRTYEHAVDNPHIAIVDFLQNGITAEFEQYCRTFALHGYNCHIADVCDLRYDGRVLRDGNGRRIDAIWRRCVTNDILEFWEESQPLINAVADGKVALIGSFAGHIMHDKQIFDALVNPVTQAFLTEEERKIVHDCIPQTRFLDSKHCDVDEIRSTKDAWIIKPTDAYGASDVFIGKMHTEDEWNAIVDKYAESAAGAPFIVQTFLNPYKTQVIPHCDEIESLEDADVPRETQAYNNLNGLYVFNGKFSGVFSRLGPRPIIAFPNDRTTCASMWVDCDF